MSFKNFVIPELLFEIIEIIIKPAVFAGKQKISGLYFSPRQNCLNMSRCLYMNHVSKSVVECQKHVSKSVAKWQKHVSKSVVEWQNHVSKSVA
jgi:hypothetical protein